jgi:hypothetical protein
MDKYNSRAQIQIFDTKQNTDTLGCLQLITISFIVVAVSP